MRADQRAGHLTVRGLGRLLQKNDPHKTYLGGNLSPVIRHSLLCLLRQGETDIQLHVQAKDPDHPRL